jgi:hypothetical protein
LIDLVKVSWPPADRSIGIWADDQIKVALQRRVNRAPVDAVLSIATSVPPDVASQSRISSGAARVVPKVRTSLRDRLLEGPLFTQATTLA